VIRTPKHVAILGGKGMLGTDLIEILAVRGLIPTSYDLPEFDLRDPRHIERVLEKTEAVVNCAAYTNVDGAESNAETAYSINADAVGVLGRLAAGSNIPILHISTDFVFNGKEDLPYRENDPAVPLGIYGKSKLKGELLLMQSGCHYCTVRVQWTYGAAGNNFIEKILKRGQDGRPLKVVDDQTGAPTSTREVASALTDLLLQPDGMPQGLFHFAASGYVSRFEVARFVVEKKGLDVDIIPCKSHEFISPAQRPLNSRFDCGKIAEFLTEPIKPWQVPLEHYLENVS